MMQSPLGMTPLRDVTGEWQGTLLALGSARPPWQILPEKPRGPPLCLLESHGRPPLAKATGGRQAAGRAGEGTGEKERWPTRPATQARGLSSTAPTGTVEPFSEYGNYSWNLSYRTIGRISRSLRNDRRFECARILNDTTTARTTSPLEHFPDSSFHIEREIH